MASIINIQPPTAQDLGSDRWRLSVTYTAEFSDFEVNNFNFRDAIQVWEDDTFSDDRITSWRNFRHFNPSSNRVQRTKTTTVSDDSLDTEWGAEEIYLKIRLQNVDLLTPSVIRNSRNISISP